MACFYLAVSLFKENVKLCLLHLDHESTTDKNVMLQWAATTNMWTSFLSQGEMGTGLLSLTEFK